MTSAEGVHSITFRDGLNHFMGEMQQQSKYYIAFKLSRQDHRFQEGVLLDVRGYTQGSQQNAGTGEERRQDSPASALNPGNQKSSSSVNFTAIPLSDGDGIVPALAWGVSWKISICLKMWKPLKWLFCFALFLKEYKLHLKSFFGGRGEMRAYWRRSEIATITQLIRQCGLKYRNIRTQQLATCSTSCLTLCQVR